MTLFSRKYCNDVKVWSVCIRKIDGIDVLSATKDPQQQGEHPPPSCPNGQSVRPSAVSASSLHPPVPYPQCQHGPLSPRHPCHNIHICSHLHGCRRFSQHLDRRPCIPP